MDIEITIVYGNRKEKNGQVEWNNSNKLKFIAKGKQESLDAFNKMLGDIFKEEPKRRTKK